MEILQSSVTGNIIGIISLIIGVIGVILTVRTMKSAKRIEEQIKKETALALDLDKEHFREYREKCIKKLKSNRRNVQQEKRVSYSLYGVLGFQVERVIISREKSLVYHPEYRGVRLDIYAKDENHTHYNAGEEAGESWEKKPLLS